MITKLLVCHSPQTNPYWNLALEEYLFDTVPQGTCILYLWQNRKTVVIGRNQNSRKECRLDALEKDGGFLARRLSGGGAVFHDLGNLNFTFLVQDPDYQVQKQLSVIQAAVRRFHLQAEISGRNDVTVDGRKFSGNAFYHSGSRHYHHGTLLLSCDTAQMARYLNPDPIKLQAKGVSSVRSRVVNLCELAPSVTVESMKQAMRQAFEEVYGLPSRFLSLPPEEELAPRKEKFASFAWRIGQEPAFAWQGPNVRFSWGCAQLGMEVAGGVIQKAVLYTDSMDPSLAEVLGKVLTGVVFSPAAVCTALREQESTYPEQSLPLRELSELFAGGEFPHE